MKNVRVATNAKDEKTLGCLITMNQINTELACFGVNYQFDDERFEKFVIQQGYEINNMIYKLIVDHISETLVEDDDLISSE